MVLSMIKANYSANVNMQNEDKAKEQLIEELSEARRRIAELEALELDCRQTEEELKQRKGELNSLYVIAATVSRSLNLEEVLDTALDEVLAVLKAQGGIIYLFDESRQAYFPSVHCGISQDVLREVTGFKAGEGLSGQVAKSGEAIVVSDITSDPRNISPSSIRDKWRSYAGVPINSKGKVLGVMILTSRQENYFKPENLGLLNHIGNHIGVAVENAQAYEMTKRAENDLRQSEQRFHQMAEVIPAIFWMYSADFSRLIYVSPAYDKIFGYPRARLYGKPDLWINYVHPEDRDRVLSNREKYHAEDYEMEYRIVQSNGSIRWIYARIFPIRDEFEDIKSIAGLSEDITERKDAEEQIRRYNEELEEIVEQRTARIRELERQRTEIEKLVATGRMATRIAHEINNPLAGIKNSFLLIKDAVPDKHPHYEYVSLIEKEIERIAWIVRQMFDLYRPDQDPVRTSPVQEVINDVTALLDSSCREYGVSIEVDSSHVSTDATIQDALLRQILYNIIQNGIEASSPGGVVAIAVDVVEYSLIIRISDQGVGIPEEARFRIFEPFFTTKSSLTNGGLGLGLSVSKSIIEAMGGSIDFESSIGRGTTFTVTLPIESERSEVRNV